MVQLCYWSKTLSPFSPSFSTTPSIFYLSLSLLHNSYLSIFLPISFLFLSFPFPFRFSPLLHWHGCWHFCPLWVWQGLTLAICVSCLSFTFIHFSFLLLLLLSLSPIITLTSKSFFCSLASSFSFVLYLVHHLLSHSCLPSFLIISFIS